MCLHCGHHWKHSFALIIQKSSQVPRRFFDRLRVYTCMHMSQAVPFEASRRFSGLFSQNFILDLNGLSSLLLRE